VGAVDADPIAAFYDRHPYPPPVAASVPVAHASGDEASARVAHHLIWPERPPASVRAVLVAGCGTSQSVRHAQRYPAARVVGIDVSAAALRHTADLAARRGVQNLELHHLALERVEELDARFDHVVCTGVLHHLADPPRGLQALRAVLADKGAMSLMVYARYGRIGVSMLQEYCRRLGVSTSPDELAQLVATLRELPLGHPLSRLLRESRDYLDDDALADALCNPRDRAYCVPELLELVTGAGLRLGRWERQAPYLPDCGSISETPHAARIAALPTEEQWAVAELFRGTITRHSAILFRADDTTSGALDFTTGDIDAWVPVRAATAVAVQERLPRGVAAALLNRAHTDVDLVLFADASQLEIFRSIDGQRSIGELGPGAGSTVERLWRHDLVVCDTIRTASP
jgi:SAM-dependent methyltransferase